MELFVKRSERVDVDVWAWEVDGMLQASPDEKDAPRDAEIKKLKFVFRKPSYRDSNYILGAADIKAAAQRNDTEVNAIAFNDAVVRTLLLEMHDGEQVYQMNAQRLSELHPMLSRAAIAGVMGKISI
jgi:hypothetical protein